MRSSAPACLCALTRMCARLAVLLQVNVPILGMVENMAYFELPVRV